MTSADRAHNRWSAPVPEECFVVTQAYLHEDWQLYPEFGHHTGVDYGNAGQASVPLFAVANGEIVFRGESTTPMGAYLGNHATLYVPAANRSFLYCHMAGGPPVLGRVQAGQQIGVMGSTGESTGVHPHFEGYFGKFSPELRDFISLQDIEQKTFDPDALLREHIRGTRV